MKSLRGTGIGQDAGRPPAGGRPFRAADYQASPSVYLPLVEPVPPL